MEEYRILVMWKSGVEAGYWTTRRPTSRIGPGPAIPQPSILGRRKSKSRKKKKTIEEATAGGPHNSCGSSCDSHRTRPAGSTLLSARPPARPGARKLAVTFPMATVDSIDADVEIWAIRANQDLPCGYLQWRLLSDLNLKHSGQVRDH